MITQLRQFVFFCLVTTLLLCGDAGAAIVNKASASFAQPGGAAGAVESNTVRAQRTDTITYFTSAAFTTVARATRANGQLFVQISAADCNADPSRAEDINVTISSKKSGDRQSFMAAETAADSGLFRITPMTMDRSQDEDGHENDVGDGMLEVVADDVLTASIAGCGNGTISTDILVDPIGIVYDSVSNEPIPGATVTLIDVTGEGNGGNPGAPAIVFDVDGATRMPSTVVTDGNGMYHFPLVAPSLYRLKVVAPNNYGFPSKTAPGLLPGERETNLYGSYGGEFTVSAALGVVTIDIPLDPIPGTLYLQKTASRAVVEVGDVLDYTVRVFNTADEALSGVTVIDDLPAGFSYVPGSMRLDNAPFRGQVRQPRPAAGDQCGRRAAPLESRAALPRAHRRRRATGRRHQPRPRHQRRAAGPDQRRGRRQGEGRSGSLQRQGPYPGRRVRRLQCERPA